MIERLKEISTANRLDDIQRQESSKGIVIEGDFKGSVTGRWKKLGDMGEGVVTYNDKEYITKPIGFASVPKDTEVELSYANGIYYSKY